ncbi:MAG: hypothetical protein JW937_07585 [Candidatus Omnitrophica bacterium]|nr:hypothetical protein [Candidatus Omnitrophota bacterium]
MRRLRSRRRSVFLFTVILVTGGLLLITQNYQRLIAESLASSLQQRLSLSGVHCSIERVSLYAPLHHVLLSKFVSPEQELHLPVRLEGANFSFEDSSIPDIFVEEVLVLLDGNEFEFKQARLVFGGFPLELNAKARLDQEVWRSWFEVKTQVLGFDLHCEAWGSEGRLDVSALVSGPGAPSFPVQFEVLLQEGKIRVPSLQCNGVDAGEFEINLDKQEWAFEGSPNWKGQSEGPYWRQPAHQAASLVAAGKWDAGKIEAEANIQHLKIRDMDWVGVLSLALVQESPEASWSCGRGDLKFDRTILNLTPVDDFVAHFAWSPGEFRLAELRAGKFLSLAGRLELRPPYEINMLAEIQDTSLKGLIDVLNPSIDKKLVGTVEGEIRLEGPLFGPQFNGRFESRDGRLGEILYESLYLGASGAWPVLNLVDARINRPGGYMTLEGELDLREMGKPYVFRNVRTLLDGNTVVWHGWDIQPDDPARPFSIGKHLSEKVYLSFVSRLNDERLHPGDDDSELELKYLIQGRQKLQVSISDQEEFVGIAHEVKF